MAHRVVSGNSVYYYAEDLLGSSRALATAAGGICLDADFYPYGGERDYVDTCPQNYKFTGKERDPETNNDDFDARYYSSAYGRFLSADWSSTPAPVPYANLTNPQTLNLYAMVSDNPESFVDLDGHGTNDQSNSQPGNCASAGSAAGGKQDAAQNAGTATVNYVPYEVHGSTAAEAMEQANAGGYAGNTSFTIAPTAQASYSVTPGANGSVSVTATATGVQVSMTITVSTPHWAAEKSASSEDQKTWDQAANSNMAHEQAHVQMDKAAIPGIAKALTGTSATAKGQTASQAGDKANATLSSRFARVAVGAAASLQAQNDAFDANTHHGGQN